MNLRSPGTSTKWLFVRLAFVAYFASSGLAFRLSGGDPGIGSLPAWPFILVFLAPLCFTASYLRQEFRRKSDDRDWSRPTWFSNPFSGPAHGSHLASSALLGLGAVGLITVLYLHRSIIAPLVLFLFGLGIYGGLIVFYGYFYHAKPKA